MSTKPHSSPDTSPKNKPSTHVNSGDIRLSVVIACWNAAKTLPVQLEALANQQWDKPWEVVFVDNGSTDDSMAIAEQYRSRIPEMQIIAATEKQNQQYALNVGVRAARSDAIALCDADDEVAPGWVAAMGEALARYDFVAGPWETSKLNDPWIAAGHGNAQKNGLMQQPGYFSYAGSGNMGIRRSAWEKVGGFNEDLPGAFDTDFCWKMALAGYQLQFVPEAVLHLRFRTSFRGAFRQSHNWGMWKTYLERYYHVPGSNISFRERFISSTKKQIRTGLRIRSKSQLLRWIRGIGWYTGQLKGARMPVPDGGPAAFLLDNDELFSTPIEDASQADLQLLEKS